MWRVIVLIGGVALAIVLILPNGVVPAERMSATLSIHGKSIYGELATTGATRALGLGNRKMMPDDKGMLFVFPDSRRHGMWMKGMRFPLDIIWLSPLPADAGGDQTLVVVDRKENVAVETYPNVFYPSTDARYVLEMNGGAAKKFGIETGSVMTLKR